MDPSLPYSNRKFFSPQLAYYACSLCFFSYYNPAGWMVRFTNLFGWTGTTFSPITNGIVPAFFTMFHPKGTTLVIQPTTNYTQWLGYVVNSAMSPCAHMVGNTFTPFEIAAEYIYGQVVANVPKNLPVFLCGHSLGGAVATILAGKLAAQGWNVSGCYSFGSPKQGDVTYYNGHTAPVTRVFLDGDIIPLLPHPGLTRALNPLTGQPYLPELFSVGTPVEIGPSVPTRNVWEFFTITSPLAYVASITSDDIAKHSAERYLLALNDGMSADVRASVLGITTTVRDAAVGVVPYVPLPLDTIRPRG